MPRSQWKGEGKVDLLPYAQGGDIRKDEELLQMVMEVIDFGEMPPEEGPDSRAGKATCLDLKQLLRRPSRRLRKLRALRSAE